jgi:hypothetical protein
MPIDILSSLGKILNNMAVTNDVAKRQEG